MATVASNRIVRVAQIGLGRWSELLINAAAKSEKIEIAAGFSRSLEKREACAKKHKIDMESSYEQHPIPIVTQTRHKNLKQKNNGEEH